MLPAPSVIHDMRLLAVLLFCFDCFAAVATNNALSPCRREGGAGCPARAANGGAGGGDRPARRPGRHGAPGAPARGGWVYGSVRHSTCMAPASYRFATGFQGPRVAMFGIRHRYRTGWLRTTCIVIHARGWGTGWDRMYGRLTIWPCGQWCALASAPCTRRTGETTTGFLERIPSVRYTLHKHQTLGAVFFEGRYCSVARWRPPISLQVSFGVVPLVGKAGATSPW